MQFNEKQLVDLLYHDWTLGSFFPSKKGQSQRCRHLKMRREHQLPSQRRIDLLVTPDRERILWVIEAKVVAYPAAIQQAFEYRDELLQSMRSSGLRIAFVTIAAQYFTPETLFFARHLGVQCLHIAPINAGEANLHEIQSFDLELGMKQSEFLTNPIFHSNVGEFQTRWPKRLEVAHGAV